MYRNVEELPPELIEKILRFIPPKDLCSVVLTSNFLRTLASKPKFWCGMAVDQDKIEEDGLPKLFSINRFKKVRKINLWEMTTEKLVMNLNCLTLSSVRELDLVGVRVSIEEVPAELLARVARNLQKLDLGGAYPTTDQCLALMEVCIASPTLIDVNFEDADLDEVPAELLAQAVGNLHKVNLNYTMLNNEQCTAVLEVCITSSSLIDVSLDCTNREEVPVQLLARGVGHLNKVHLGDTNIDLEQCLAVLEVCISSSTLTDVNFMGNGIQCLEKVPAKFLAWAVGHLQKVNLRYTDMTNEQCRALLEVCICSPTLVDVHFESAGPPDHREIFEEVPNDLLARAVGCLQTVNLTGCRLTPEQCIVVLESAVSSSTLVNFSVDSVEGVPAQLLKQAVGSLQTLDLYWSRLTTEQGIAILEASISSTSLIKLNITLKEEVEAEIPADLLTSARKTGRLEHEPFWTLN